PVRETFRRGRDQTIARPTPCGAAEVRCHEGVTKSPAGGLWTTRAPSRAQIPLFDQSVAHPRGAAISSSCPAGTGRAVGFLAVRVCGFAGAPHGVDFPRRISEKSRGGRPQSLVERDLSIRKNFLKLKKGQTRDKVAAAVGLGSGRTYEKPSSGSGREGGRLRRARLIYRP